MFTIPFSTKNIYADNDGPFFFIAGPCAIEGHTQALETAWALKEIFDVMTIPFLYKSSFDKANRSSISSFRGVGMKEGLSILADVRQQVGVPILTDVHSVEQAAPVAEVVDMLQTPAFLCRQTDLIEAVAATGKPVNIKKGQFLAPWEMNNILKKAKATGNDSISLCERGTTLGYGNLVVDMRSIEIMKRTGHPVVFDATHSVQLPGAQGTCSGGQREFVPVLAKAAASIGVAGMFMEVHPDPDNAPCDGSNMIAIKELPALLEQLQAFDKLAKGI